MISPVKRLVAAAAMLAMLLCQSAALAQACSETAAHSAGATERPCHAGADPVQQSGEAAEAGCLVSSPSTQPANFFYDVTDLPAVRVSACRVDDPAPALFPDTPLLRTEPPPLRIVHCCLRN